MPQHNPPATAAIGHDLIVVGASAGGVEALLTLAAGLPVDLPAAVCVVLHVPPTSPSVLPLLLSRSGPLPASHAEHGEALEHGRIYVAPPDFHLLVRPGRLALGRGPRENRSRPAVDVLFRTAALAYGRRVVGVVLSGTLDDGTVGLGAVKECGGIAIVQSPDDALFEGMPRNAIERVEIDVIAPCGEIASVLTRLAREPVVGNGVVPVPDDLMKEAMMTDVDTGLMRDATHPGTPSSFSCPDCGGSLWDIGDDRLPRFRCRVGHAFAAESLLAAQNDGVEEALWAALRALEEKIELLGRLLDRARALHQDMIARRYTEQIEEAKTRADSIRRVVSTRTADRGSEPAAVG